MNYEDLLVIGFMLLHGAAFLSVIRWLGYFMMARNQLGEAGEQTRAKERKARLPALIFAALLAASYAALFILQAKLKK